MPSKETLEQFGSCWEGLEDPRHGNAALHDLQPTCSPLQPLHGFIASSTPARANTGAPGTPVFAMNVCRHPAPTPHRPAIRWETSSPRGQHDAMFRAQGRSSPKNFLAVSCSGCACFKRPVIAPENGFMLFRFSGRY
jgi:hypothetical protein